MTDGATLVGTYNNGKGGTLSGVTLDGTLDLASNNVANVTVTGGLTLNGTIDIGSAGNTTYGWLNFVGAQTFAGTGAVLFGGSAYGNDQINTATLNGDSGTLTIGPGITIHGKNGSIGNAALPLINQGTIAADVGGGQIGIYGTAWTSSGTLQDSGGALNLYGSWSDTGPIIVNAGTVSVEGTGTLDAGFSGGGGTVDFDGTLDDAGTTLGLDGSAVSYVLNGAAIDGGTVSMTDGATLVGIYNNGKGGTLSGVTLDGTLDLASINGANVTVTGGLTLDGTIDIGSASNTTYGRLNFVGAQTFAGTGAVVFGGSAYGNNQINTATLNDDSGTLTIGSGITIHGKNGSIGNAALPLINQGIIAADTGGQIGVYGSGWTNSGTITATAAAVSLSGAGSNSGTLQSTNGGTLSSSGGALTSTGIIEAYGTSTVNLNNSSVTINSPGVLIVQPAATMNIAGSVLGNTTDADLFEPQGTVNLDGAGTSTIPQFLEVMGDDLGNVSAGFHDNFAYNTLVLGSNDYVRLVDLQDNSGSGSPEALFVNTLIVPSGSTLDLNGLHLYYRTASIKGTIAAGSATPLTGGGSVALNTSNPGNLQFSGQVNDWSFFARAGEPIDIFLHTGSGGNPSPIQPALDFGRMTLLDPNGNTIAVASNTQSGADASILNQVLPADGTYQVEVQAPRKLSTTGNYILAAYDATVTTSPLELNQTVNGQVGSPYSQDNWTFSATAGTQIQFNLIASQSSSIQFALAGPAGFTGITGLTTSSLINLPVSGTYTLNVSTGGVGNGAYAFQLQQTTQTNLALGTSYTGSLVGSGQAQLFQITVSQVQGLLVSLQDNSGADQNELYLQFGSPPTRSDYQYRFSNVASPNQQILVPSATAGTWYALLYATANPAPSVFSILAKAAPIFLTGVTPDHYSNSQNATLYLTGSGFDQTTTVSLVAVNGTTYPASTVSLDSATQISATFDANTVPEGVYSVVVDDTSGASDELSDSFTFVEGGEATLSTQLIIPAQVGYHISSVFYVQYSNTGDVSMQAPLLVLSATQDGRDGAIMSLNPANAGEYFRTASMPAGFSNTIQILASGAVPGLLLPGESIQVPVYYGGWVQPWDFGYPAINFNLTTYQVNDPTPVDWSSMMDSLRPASYSSDEWAAVYSNLTARIGDTWGSYVANLDLDATYLDNLGTKDSNVQDLWDFEIQQDNNAGPLSQIATTTDVSAPADGLTLEFNRGFATSIVGRYTLGPLGYGWELNGSWQDQLTEQPQGSVSISQADGSQLLFQPKSGGYSSPLGDTDTLVALGGGSFSLQSQDGLTTVFSANGSVQYEQDADGDRITATYTNGLLTGLTASDDQSIQIAYNAAGLIDQVTGPSGQVTYSYDPSNEYLLSVTSTSGQTSYSYSTGGSAVMENALLLVQSPNGMNDAYSYDSQGNLAGLLSGYAVSGQVTDANGNPIASAVVTLVSESNSQTQYSVDTLADGSYAFPAVPPGTYDLVVVANNDQALVRTALVVSGTTTLSPASLTASTTQLTGIVVDSNNQAIPNANVAVLDADGHNLGTAVTAADGSFVITTAFGSNLTIVITVPGSSMPKTLSISLPAGTSLDLGQVDPGDPSWLVAIIQQLGVQRDPE